MLGGWHSVDNFSLWAFRLLLILLWASLSYWSLSTNFSSLNTRKQNMASTIIKCTCNVRIIKFWVCSRDSQFWRRFKLVGIKISTRGTLEMVEVGLKSRSYKIYLVQMMFLYFQRWSRTQWGITTCINLWYGHFCGNSGYEQQICFWSFGSGHLIFWRVSWYRHFKLLVGRIQWISK